MLSAAAAWVDTPRRSKIVNAAAFIRRVRPRSRAGRSNNNPFERPYRQRVPRGIQSSTLSLPRTTYEPTAVEPLELQAELVARLRRAEPAAVAEVYDDHQAALRAFACKLTG